jgi:hypothetical protein
MASFFETAPVFIQQVPPIYVVHEKWVHPSTCIRIIVDVLKMNMFCSLLSIMNSSTNTSAYHMTSSIFHLQLRRATTRIKNTSCLKEQSIIFSNSQLLPILLFWSHWKHLVRHWEIFKRFYFCFQIFRTTHRTTIVFSQWGIVDRSVLARNWSDCHAYWVPIDIRKIIVIWTTLSI